MKSISQYFADILKCIQKIETFVQGMSFEEFESDERTADTVIRQLEIIGEAAEPVFNLCPYQP